jgi:preprotein translocase subunit SecD
MQTYKIFLVAVLLACGCASFDDKNATTLRFYEQVSSSLPNKLYREVAIPKTGLTLQIDRYPVLTERDIVSSELYATSGGPAILLRLEIHGNIVLDEVTTRSRGRYLVVLLDGRPVMAWFMDKRINNGAFLLEGDFTAEEAKKAVESLNKQSKKRNSDW